MKHAALLIIALFLGALGTFLLVWDIVHSGTLHVLSASIGTGALAVALLLAIPLEMRAALDALAPLLPVVVKRGE